MEDPFVLEARSHWAQANRNGRIAFQTFLATIASFAVLAWNVDASWAWWFWLGAVAFATRMFVALEARWFHRKATRIALEFHTFSKRLG